MESKESVPQLPSATDEPEPISGISREKEVLKLHLTIITEDPGIVNRSGLIIIISQKLPKNIPSLLFYTQG